MVAHEMTVERGRGSREPAGSSADTRAPNRAMNSATTPGGKARRRQLAQPQSGLTQDFAGANANQAATKIIAATKDITSGMVKK